MYYLFIPLLAIIFTFGYIAWNMQKKINDLNERVDHKASRILVKHHAKECQEERKKLDFTFKRAKFNRDRVDDVLKALGEVEHNFAQFGGFIANVLNMVIGHEPVRPKHSESVKGKKSKSKEDQITDMTREFFGGPKK